MDFTFDFMSIRKGDVFSQKKNNKFVRYVVIDYNENVVRAVNIDNPRITNNTVTVKNFTYIELERSCVLESVG